MISAKLQSQLNQSLYGHLPPARVGICRILHDRECSRIRGGSLAEWWLGLRYPYLSRFYNPAAKKLRGLPETVRYNGGRSHVRLSIDWVDFLWSHNTNIAAEYLMRPDSGWRNKGDTSTVEQLGWGGAYVVVTHIDGNKAYIESYDNSRNPDSYIDRDYLQLFSVIDQSNNLSGSPVGNAYSFVISNPGERLWIDTQDITFVRPVAPLAAAAIASVMEMAG